jgi:signal transduction histidine kinase/CheY-like chemotaxis protein
MVDWLRDTVEVLWGAARHEEDHPTFRRRLREIARAGLLGGGILGFVGVAVYVGGQAILAGSSVGWSFGAVRSHDPIVLVDKIIVAVTLAGLLVAAYRRCSLRTARVAMGAAALVIAGASLYIDLVRDELAVEYLTIAFIVAVAAVPFRPLQTLALGTGLIGVLLSIVALGGVLVEVDLARIAWTGDVVHLTVVMLLMTGVSTLLYASRWAQYRARHRAETLRDEVAQLERTKSQFFANISHELRTPLTLILGPLEEALDERYGALSDALRRRLQTTREQAQRLQVLVEQLLDLSKLDEERMELDARPMALAPFLRRMRGLVASEAERRDLALRLDVQEPATACADPEALETIVTNLLLNALKYTPAGGQVRLQLRAVDGPPPQAEIRVRDTGPGIPDDVRATLFDRYARAADGERVTDLSAGLGLALVKELVDRHGGRVEVQTGDDASPAEPADGTAQNGTQESGDTDEAVGTEFVVRLPCSCDALPARDRADRDAPDEEAVADGAGARSDRQAAPSTALRIPSAKARPAAAPSRPSDDEAPTVLVVDDDRAVREYLRDILASHYDVRTAAGGDEALDLTRRLRPALVVSDVVMPGRDGFALCQAIREDEALRATPVILLTVRAEEDSRLEGLRHGADAYLGKPFHPDELRQRAENLIDVRRFLRHQQADAGALPTPRPGPGDAAAAGGPDREPDREPQDRAQAAEEAASAEAAAGAEDGAGAAASAEDGGAAPEAERDADEEASDFLQAVRRVVHRHVDNSNFGVAWLADEVDLSTRQLQRRIREATGLSAGAYIRTLRLQHAARLLREGTVDTVAAAADAVGYRDASHFSRLFREAFGVSPADLPDADAGDPSASDTAAASEAAASSSPPRS